MAKKQAPPVIKPPKPNTTVVRRQGQVIFPDAKKVPKGYAPKDMKRK